MRLYLSSFRMGDHTERLLALLRPGATDVAVIANAMDAQPADERSALASRSTRDLNRSVWATSKGS